MLLRSSEGISLLLFFALAMLAMAYRTRQASTNTAAFLLANRSIPLWRAICSIAVSWIWAPAIFICSLQSYTKGIAGIFWFTLPNVLCFFLVAPLALRLRQLLPKGYTLPEFIAERFSKHQNVHIAYLVVFFGYQLAAIIINCVAGGALIHALSGIDLSLAITSIAFISLSYSLLSGLQASVLTDVIQMALLVLVTLVLLPWCLSEVDGFASIDRGLGGVSGEYRNTFHPWIAFTMGIPMTFGLLAGPIADQMFFQRAMAVRESDIIKTFVGGGLLFSLVPIGLSLLGFIGADMVNRGLLVVEDPQLVGPLVVGYLLPKTALYAFCLMAFAGLCSTMDSALCAISSLSSIDVYRRYFNSNPSDTQIVRWSRGSMIVFTVLGTGIALLNPKLLWIFLTYGTLASAAMCPTILALYWRRATAQGTFYAVTTAVLLSLPLAVYANIVENAYLIVAATVISVGLGLLVSLVFGDWNTVRDTHAQDSAPSPTRVSRMATY